MDLGLKGKVAIITGGARGIGAGISEVLAQEGAHLVIDYRSAPEECEAFAKRLSEQYGVKTVAIQSDISTKEGVDRVYDCAMQMFGTVDLLVNNAAVLGNQKIEDITLDSWQKFMDTNVTAVFLMSQRFIQICREQKKGGRAVNVIAKGFYAITDGGMSEYVTSKGGAYSFTRSIAKEVAPDGIIFNGLVPGYVNSHFANFEDGSARSERRRQNLPRKMFASPRDMGHVTAFLLSETCATQVIGVIMDATGGLLL